MSLVSGLIHRSALNMSFNLKHGYICTKRGCEEDTFLEPKLKRVETVDISVWNREC